MPNIPSRIPILNIPTTSTPHKLDFSLLDSEYLVNYLNKNSITDSTYSIRFDGHVFNGNKDVKIANDEI